MNDLLLACAPSDSLAAAEARLVVRACLAQLTTADRFLAELRFFHGWTLLDVAQLDGRSELELGRTCAKILDLLRARLGITNPMADQAGMDLGSDDVVA